MNINKRNRCFLSVVILFFYILATSTSCVRNIGFVNYTSDTLVVGTAYYDNIDSVKYKLWCGVNSSTNAELDTLWKDHDFYFDIGDIIYPDSIGGIDECCLFNFGKTDTCYFFLIKWSDAKRYSWDEIRDKKMYHTWIVTRNKKGEFDKNIKYTNSIEH